MFCCWSPPVSKTKSLELVESLGAERQNILEFSGQSITRNLSDHQDTMLSVTDRALSYIEQNSRELRKLHRSVRVEAHRDIAEILSLSRENLNFADATEDVRPRLRRISRLRSEIQLESIPECDYFHPESSSEVSAEQLSRSNVGKRAAQKDSTLKSRATVE